MENVLSLVIAVAILWFFTRKPEGKKSKKWSTRVIEAFPRESRGFWFSIGVIPALIAAPWIADVFFFLHAFGLHDVALAWAVEQIRGAFAPTGA